MNPSPTNSRLMTVQINDRTMEVAQGTTVATLLQTVALRGGPVAVELNRQLIPQDQHTVAVLHQGDQVEIVSLTGGG